MRGEEEVVTGCTVLPLIDVCQWQKKHHSSIIKVNTLIIASHLFTQFRK